jgi:hypothetical protein
MHRHGNIGTGKSTGVARSPKLKDNCPDLLGRPVGTKIQIVDVPPPALPAVKRRTWIYRERL